MEWENGGAGECVEYKVYSRHATSYVFRERRTSLLSYCPTSLRPSPLDMIDALIYGLMKSTVTQQGGVTAEHRLVWHDSTL